MYNLVTVATLRSFINKLFPVRYIDTELNKELPEFFELKRKLIHAFW